MKLKTYKFKIIIKMNKVKEKQNLMIFKEESLSLNPFDPTVFSFILFLNLL